MSLTLALQNGVVHLFTFLIRKKNYIIFGVIFFLITKKMVKTLFFQRFHSELRRITHKLVAALVVATISWIAGEFSGFSSGFLKFFTRFFDQNLLTCLCSPYCDSSTNFSTGNLQKISTVDFHG
jgi:hypothetical protein